MSTHGVAEAMEKLDDLIERALNGEEIVIERDGQPVAELSPIAALKPERRITDEDIEWLRKHPVPQRRVSTSSVTPVRQKPDED
jgi:antitoxin (DNA-binding transcriptional repressor) of toxin-antitoxin stability system